MAPFTQALSTIAIHMYIKVNKVTPKLSNQNKPAREVHGCQPSPLSRRNPCTPTNHTTISDSGEVHQRREWTISYTKEKLLKHVRMPTRYSMGS